MSALRPGGKGCSALLLAGSDLVGSMQGKLVERVQIPVKHGAIGQSFPVLARNYGTAALTQRGFQPHAGSSRGLSRRCSPVCSLPDTVQILAEQFAALADYLGAIGIKA